jgi:MoxR-like ATPase
VGYPLPDAAGELRFVRTPASIWGARAVFLDEISRCRFDMQNKLFSIVYDRKVQGIELEGLAYRWAAMNPPPREDQDATADAYLGCQPLDPALADRFAFVVEVPCWEKFSAEKQMELIRNGGRPESGNAASRLRSLLSTAKVFSGAFLDANAAPLAEYVQTVCALLRTSGVALSARRAVTLYSNIAAVHGVRLAADPQAKPGDSALLALRHSIPQRASGASVQDLSLLTAHREAWSRFQFQSDSKVAVLLREADPLRRALLCQRAGKLPRAEFSSIVADCISVLPPGASHALAVQLFESGAAGRLLTAVASQCASLYSVAATPQNLRETLATRSVRHQAWHHITNTLSKRDPKAPDAGYVENLLVGLFAAGTINSPEGADAALAAWDEARAKILEFGA